MKKKVLLLGAAGRIGTGFVEEYLNDWKFQKAYDLILGVHDKKFKADGFKIRRVSIDDKVSLRKAMKGVDVVVNLAANPDPKAKFDDLVEPNLVGVYNVFEVAVKSKCDRVIFASSVHAVEGDGSMYKVKSSGAPRPMDLYGASNGCGEALG